MFYGVKKQKIRNIDIGMNQKRYTVPLIYYYVMNQRIVICLNYNFLRDLLCQHNVVFVVIEIDICKCDIES